MIDSNVRRESADVSCLYLFDHRAASASTGTSPRRNHRQGYSIIEQIEWNNKRFTLHADDRRTSVVKAVFRFSYVEQSAPEKSVCRIRFGPYGVPFFFLALCVSHSGLAIETG